MSISKFLLSYLGRYQLWIGLSFAAIGAFFISSVLMVALIVPVFKQVMPTEKMSQEDLGKMGAFLDVEGGTSPCDDLDLDVAATDRTESDVSSIANDGDPEQAEDPSLLDRLGSYQKRTQKRIHCRFAQLYADVQVDLGVSPDNRLWKPQYFAPILFVLVFALRSASSFFSAYTFQRIGYGITTDIRNDLYDFLLGQSSVFHSENPSGKLFSRVINDVGRMQNAFTNRLVDLFQQSVMLVVCLVGLFMIHAQMAFVSLVAMPLIIYPVVRFGRGMFKTSHRSQERMEDLAELLTEGIRGNRVVKAFGMEEFESRRFKAATRRHLNINLRAQVLASASSPVVETLSAIGGCTLLVVAGDMIRRESLTPSVFMAFLALLFMLYDPIRKLNKVNIIVQEALAATDRVNQMLSTPVAIRDEPKHAPIETITQGISFENVSFAYGEKKVLRDFNLTVKAGEVVALVGSSGAGKSTVVNLLPRFFDPASGTVRIDGVDIRDLPLQNLRSLIGLVTQDTMLFNDSVRNNIAYGRSDLPFDEVRKAGVAAYADEFINEQESGYETVIGESGHQLSGGQRQRLAIARALLKNAPILILDEATSHLDSESEQLVQRAVYNLMEGRTALVIAHRLSTVTRADRILVMQDGVIVEEGDHETLIANGGTYQNLYEMQFQTT